MRTITFLAFLLVIFSGNAQPRKWRVNNNPSYNIAQNGVTVFNDLQQAVSTVQSGDTLYVEASAMDYGNVIVQNKAIHFVGSGYFLNENPSTQHNTLAARIRRITFDVGSSGSSVSGLELTAQGSVASIVFTNTDLSNITIRRCNLEQELDFNNNADHLITNILVEQSFVNDIAVFVGPVTNVVLTNNFFPNLTIPEHFIAVISQNVFGNIVNIQGQPFYNNIVLGSSINQNNNSINNIHHNLFDFAQPAWLNGGTNVFGVPQANIFADLNASSDKKYQLKPQNECPGCYQGTPAGQQVGMFGGSSPYRISGVPAIPAIYNILSPTGVAAGGQLNVTLSTRANN
ncbi:hypothetical protein [Flavobacterium caeni]|uniref:Right handed beta helix region n=1 Tax=Flavobacterium caeni TaxID=490189 RepID=A0A1G5GX50_9FLAO|nr:hypothetical protein [Flavobacterium caeni]SCY55967.1 hypothetical protein SAMN02927903_01660 [Flavobacterium caeni]